MPRLLKAVASSFVCSVRIIGRLGQNGFDTGQPAGWSRSRRKDTREALWNVIGSASAASPRRMRQLLRPLRLSHSKVRGIACG
jgi:hypothetical protein